MSLSLIESSFSVCAASKISLVKAFTSPFPGNSNSGKRRGTIVGRVDLFPRPNIEWLELREGSPAPIDLVFATVPLGALFLEKVVDIFGRKLFEVDDLGTPSPLFGFPKSPLKLDNMPREREIFVFEILSLGLPVGKELVVSEVRFILGLGSSFNPNSLGSIALDLCLVDVFETELMFLTWASFDLALMV